MRGMTSEIVRQTNGLVWLKNANDSTSQDLKPDFNGSTSPLCLELSW